MIKTTMAHKVGSNPGKFAYKHPGSRNVIKTTVSKKACSADNFIKRKGSSIDFKGSPKEVD